MRLGWGSRPAPKLRSIDLEKATELAHCDSIARLNNLLHQMHLLPDDEAKQTHHSNLELNGLLRVSKKTLYPELGC